jgi:Zn-dependent protease with chaperone function
VRFRQQQEQARTATGGLLALFALTVLFTVVGVNLALALAWRLQFGWLAGYPTGFFEVNTAVTLGFVLGGAWLESVRLRDGGAHVATMIGGYEVAAPHSPEEKRLRNVVDEMAIATGLKSPRVFVLDREQAINALAAGWEPQDSVIAVTRGALERLTRDELQGVVAHEFAHILNGDTRLNMRLIGMVFGLQMVFNFGRSLMSPVADRGRRGPAVLIGLALVAAGSIGWLAGRLLKAGVSRQREYLADAYAVQFTRQPSGIGDALRKIDTQLRRGERIKHINAEIVSHLLLSSDTLVNAGALATHLSIEERLRRIFGHAMAPLPDDPLIQLDAPAPDLPPLDFAQAPAGQDGPPPVADLALAAESGGIAASSAEDALSLLLPGTTMPAQLHAAVLACLVPPGACAERAAWRRAAGTSAESQRLLQVVQALPQRKRQPWFERLLESSAALTPEQRAALRRDALALVQADGRLSLHEYLQAQVLHRLLSARRDDLALEQRNLQTTDLAGPITTVSLALASLLPGADGLTWAQAVLRGLGLPCPQQVAVPAVSELNQAIDRLALLSRMHSPALAKRWVEARPVDSLPQTMADALRCLCLLIDTPLPPALAGRFDPPTEPPQVAGDLRGAAPSCGRVDARGEEGVG